MKANRRWGLIGMALLAVFSVKLALEHRQPTQDPTLSPPALSALSNGSHVLCQETPEGTLCLSLSKAGSSVSALLGYTQSDDLICLRGTVVGNHIQGEALAVSWPGQTWGTLPNQSFAWDSTQSLQLNRGAVVMSQVGDAGTTDWIRFGSADLNAEKFQNKTTQLFPEPNQVCDWSPVNRRGSLAQQGSEMALPI